MSATALDKTIKVSEGVLLQVTQCKRSLSAVETYRSVTPKSMSALAAKVAARTTPELIKQYTDGYDASKGSGGGGQMELLQKLTDAKSQIKLLTDVVAVIHAQTSASSASSSAGAVVPTYTGNTLVLAVEEATAGQAFEGNINVYSDIAFETDLAAANLAKDWAKVRELLQSESGFLSTLDATQRSEVQDKHITKSLVDLLRARNYLGGPSTSSFTRSRA